MHITSETERAKADDISSLYVDLGTSSKEEVRDIKKGDYIYFTSKFFAQGDYYMGKAFDDRAGCSAITEILTDKKSNKIF
jgi:endoglucanase